MKRIKINDLPEDQKISRAEMRRVMGGVLVMNNISFSQTLQTSVTVVSPYHLELAKTNTLTNFRTLQTGAALELPDIEKNA